MLKTVLVVTLISLAASVRAQTVLLPAPRHVIYGKGELKVSRLSVVVPAGAPRDVVFALKELKGIIGECVGGARGGEYVGGAMGEVGADFRYTLGGAGNREYYKLRID